MVRPVWNAPAVALIGLLFFGMAATARAAEESVSIAAFYGDYEGRTLFPMGEANNRDLFVSIRPSGRFGFMIVWETTIYKQAGQPVRRSQTLDFQPTLRKNVYVGNRWVEGPVDTDSRAIVDGEPLVWARLAGRTLTVNAVTVTETGDYVVQTYDRTLTDTGLALTFTRVRNGQVERQIRGNLDKLGAN